VTQIPSAVNVQKALDDSLYGFSIFLHPHSFHDTVLAR
jgi:hypothetical protein